MSFIIPRRAAGAENTQCRSTQGGFCTFTGIAYTGCVIQGYLVHQGSDGFTRIQFGTFLPDPGENILQQIFISSLECVFTRTNWYRPR